MKRLFIIYLMLCASITGFAQAADIVVDCQNPGWLSNMISYRDQLSVRNLKVTGYVNATDLKFIGTLISKRSLDGRLDLSNCNIVKDVSEGDDNYLGSYLVPSESKSLRVLLIPKTATKVEGCTGKYLYVDSIYFDCQMTTISQNCFGGKYTKLGHLEIGENVIEIPKEAFCRIPGTNSEVKLRSVHFPSSVTSIGDDAFSMSELEMCNFNDLVNLTNLGRTIYNAAYNYRDYRTFGSYCPDTIIVPKKLEEFPLTAFFLNSGSHVFIGENTKTITGGTSTRYTYEQSGEGITFHINQLVPPNITNWFRYSNWFEGATLYVPKGAKSAYESSKWSGTNIIEVNMYPLILSSSGDGNVTYSCTTIKNQTKTFTVDEGASATISFTPDTGYRIASVKVNNTDVTSSVTNNQYTIRNISAKTTLSVTFEAIPPTTYTLSITALGNGSVSYNGTTIRSKTASFTANEGTSASISITPDNGYRVKSVKENNTDVTSYVTNGKYTINSISRNNNIEVEFEAIPPTTYTLSIKSTGNGAVSYDGTSIRGKSSTFTVAYGSSVTISFTPDTGYRIKSVKLNDTDVTTSVTNNQYIISNITGDTSVDVEFEAIPYTLSIKSAGNGAVSYDGTSIRSKSSTFTVAYGSSATISFTPDTGCRIKSVKLNDTDVTANVTNNQYTISSIMGDTSVDVEFEAIPYTLTIKSTGNGEASYDGNAIRGKSSTFTVTYGSSATVSFKPDTGYRIKSVKLNDIDVTANVTNNQYTIISISGDTSVEVEFEAIPYTLTIKSTGNGEASYDGNAIRGKSSTFTVSYGSSATVSFKSDTGYRIKSVKLSDIDVTANVTNNQYTISSISGDTSVEVEFEAIPYTLTIKSTGNGEASYDGNAIRGKSSTFTVTYGSSAALSFTPDTGCRIKSVKLNNTDVTENVTNNQYAISSISGDVSVEVVFEEIPPTIYTLNIVASGNGSVSYEGTVIRNQSRDFSVTEGNSIVLSFTPDSGYRVAKVKMNGDDVTGQLSEGKLSIKSVASDTNIEVAFEAIPITTYTLTISVKGCGEASYNGSTIRDNSSSFTINEGAYATITFTPDTGYRIKCVKLDSKDVTASVTNNQYSINGITADTSVEVEFEIITYTFTIKSMGSGCAIYNNEEIRDKTTAFTVNYGSSATVSFTPDAGYRIKSVKVGNTDVTANVANNHYTVRNISYNIALEVEFEAIPPTIYALNIIVQGSGSVRYDDSVIRNQSRQFSITEGDALTLTLVPDNGYRVEMVKLNGNDVTGELSNNQLTMNSVSSDMSVEVTFGEIPPTTYSLTIKSTGEGSVTYEDTNIRNGSKEFSLVEGAYATITFTPDEGYRMKSLSVNGEDMISFVANNQYVVSRIAKNTLVEVEFVKDVVDLAFAGINYKVVSNREQTVNVASGDYGQVLTIPNVFTVDGREWKVVGVEAGALAGMTDLAAIFWNAEAEFNGSVSNPNLLLYVKAAQYASSSITNVIVDNMAENIILSDAASGNNFYCPQSFTAKNITYEHNYSMISGYNTCQGWETLVLPFDVTKIVRQGDTELVPYQAWTQGSSQRPFWLYSLTELGWKAESSIIANTPYIISMPNNENYNPIYNVSGNIQFVGSDVQVKATDNLTSGRNGNKKLVPNYQYQDAGNGIWALNVNNLWSKNTDTAVEGSAFIQSLRPVHPFEAYLSAEGAASARRVIPVFGEGDATGIEAVRSMMSELRVETWYTLDGRQLQDKPTAKGIYILNGRKVVVK